MSDIDALVMQASVHRGLWIGMYADASEELAATIAKITDANDERDKDALKHRWEIIKPGDHHITLAHLGKSNPRERVEAVVSAAEVAAMRSTPPRVTVEGVLRLRSHLTLALAPYSTRDIVINALRDREVRIDDTFAGVPHMTIAKIPEAESPRCPSVGLGFALRFPGIRVVCGEASLYFPFADPPF